MSSAAAAAQPSPQLVRLDALEERFPGAAETQPELLAHHCDAAGLTAKAVRYCGEAGRRASEQSAHREAVRHLTRGLELLQALPESLERDRQEQALRLVLATPLIATRSYGAPEVEELGSRVRELGQRVGDPLRPGPLGVLWQFHVVRGPLPKALDLAQEVFTLSAKPGASTRALVAASMMLTQTLRNLGELRRALDHAEQGIALYDPAQYSPYVVRNVQDMGVTLLSDAALVLHLLGYPDQALERSRRAVALARQLKHPYALAWGFMFAARLHWLTRDFATASELGEEGGRITTEYGFAYQEAQGRFIRGALAFEGGQREEGLTAMRQGLEAQQATGALATLGFPLALLADVCSRPGQVTCWARSLRGSPRAWTAPTSKMPGPCWDSCDPERAQPGSEDAPSPGRHRHGRIA
jgi:tetratricopeptide (TPR) repeat protein